MPVELSEDDIKFLLSVDPDEDALKKAIDQINADIEKAKVQKIKLEIEALRTGPQEASGTSPSYLQKKFGSLGGLAQAGIDKTDYGDAFRKITAGLKGDEGLGGIVRGMGKNVGEEVKGWWKGLAGTGDAVAGGTKAAAGAAGAAAGGAGAAGAVGSAGAAAAGPAGAALVIVPAIAKAIGQIATVPFKAINSGLGYFRDALQDVQEPLGGVGAGLNAVGKGFEFLADVAKKVPVIGELLGPILDQLAKMPKVLGDVLQAGVSMASKASPGLLNQLSIAMEDAQATIGQAFLPVVQEMIPIIREMGTIIAQALPSDEEMRSMFRGLFEGLRDLIKELAPLAGPLLKSVVGIVQVLAASLSALAKAFHFVYEAVRLVVKGLTFGMVDLGRLKDEGGPKKREGIAAARPPWMGGIQEYQQRLQLQTAAGPAGRGPESVPGNVNKLAEKVGNIEEWFKKMTPEKWQEIARSVTSDPNAARTLANAAEAAARR